MKLLKLTTLLSAFALIATVAHAQDAGALLDLLVKKKVISDQEAEETRAELNKQYASTPAGKLNISTPVKQIRLYGDARLRYEWREGNAFNTSIGGISDTANADQFRYRLRLGADVTLSDQWFLGFRVETGNSARSTNVTFSNGAATAPFGKAGTTSSAFVTSVTPTTTVINGKTVVTGFKTTTTNAVTKVDFGSTIFVGQLYLRYNPFPWLVLQGGKLPQPLVTTPMLWKADINPEGFSEQVKYNVTIGKGDINADLFANFAQFVYDTATPQNQFGSSVGRNDSYQFANQIGAKINFSKTTYLQFAPTLYNYSGNKNNDFNTNFSGDPGGNQTGINDLLVFDVPFEFGWTWGKFPPLRLFGDYAVNLDGNGRASAAGHPGAGDQNTAWNFGLGINKIKKKGDWEILAYWQRSEQFSVDPNLIDNDLFDGHLNLQGIVLKAGYAVTDAVSLNLTYNHGEIIDKALGTGGAGGTLNGPTSNPAERNYNLIQADINIKF